MSPERLIDELLKNPKEFTDKGLSYQLLEFYFDGYPHETLKPLLTHSDGLVRRAAAFIASELGAGADDLLNEIILLADDPDSDTQWAALESILLCAVGKNAKEFLHVLRQLTSEKTPIRKLAMRLTSNAEHNQLSAVFDEVDQSEPSSSSHDQGIFLLLNPSAEKIHEMLNGDDALMKKYAAITAKRNSGNFLKELTSASCSDDEDVKEFAKDALDQLGQNL